MVKLLVIRHAKTDWNIGRIIQGRSDIPLSEEGRQTASGLKARLAGIKIDKVFCSPLVRAIETEQLMLGLPYEVDARLIERDFGVFDGKDYSVMTQEEKDSLFYNMDNIEGAETGQAVFERVRSFVEYIKKEFDGKTVAVFSHGVCLSYLLYATKHEEWNSGGYDMQYVHHCEILETEF